MQSQKTLVAAARICCVLTALPQFLGAAEFSSAYRVGYFNLSNETDGENPAGFVNAIDATPGMKAALADPAESGASWRTPPAERAPSEWISLVKVKAGRQCDFLAFLFSDRDGTVLYAGRRPSRIPLDPPKYPLTAPPGPRQIPANAIREPATDFLYRFPEEAARPRPSLRIVGEVLETPTAPKSDVFSIEPGGGAVDVDFTSAMAFAAAFEAGWRPTAAAATEHTLRISLREELSLYFSAQARFGDDSRTFQRRFIPKERLYDHLVGLFFQWKNAASVFDAVPYGEPGVVLLGWAGDRVVLLEDRTLRAVDPASGNVLWEHAAGPRETPKYRMEPAAQGRALLFRYDGEIRRIDLDDGTEQALTPEGIGASERFSRARDGRLAIGNASEVIVCRDREISWTWEGALPEARPVWGDGGLFVMGAGGRLHALDPGTKTERWKIAVDSPETVRLFFREGVLWVDNGKTLAAVNPQDGRSLWESPTGEVLLDGPVIMDAKVFAVVKPNMLRIWDLRTGEVMASREWPTWIQAAGAVRAAGAWRIACVDLRNRLCLFDPQTLESRREVAFPETLSPRLAYGEAVPETWSLERQDRGESWEMDLVEGMQSESAPRSPAWLVGDTRGRLFAVAVDPEREGSIFQ